MIEKWTLTITQTRKYNFSEHIYDDSIVVTHNQLGKITDLVNFLNDMFPERFKYKIESVEEDEEDDVDE